MAPNCQIINFTSDNSDWIRELLLGSAEKKGQFCFTKFYKFFLIFCFFYLLESTDVWKIETKYYKAVVQLQFVDCDDLLSLNNREDFEETEAVIFNCVNSKFCLGQYYKCFPPK